MVLILGARDPRPLPPDAETSVHYPNGQVKLQTEANDHLDRLLAPDTTIPWYRSIFANIAEMVHPEKLPPLEVTSKPVALPETWGLYRVNRKSGVMSVAIHVGLFCLLWSITTSPPAVQLAREFTTLVAPPAPFQPMEVKPAQRGGGGGGRTMAAPRASAFTPPKPVMRHYTPPLPSDRTLVAAPKLVIPPEWVGTSDPTANFGNPLEGLVGAAGNFGTGMGMGGTGAGVGSGSGSGSGGGFGSGRGGGSGSGVGRGMAPREPIYTVGKGLTPPEPVFRPDAEYSDDARKAQLSGKVVLSVVVEMDGTTSNIEVMKTLGMGLDQKAVEAVRQWRFKPATMAGKPVRARVNVEVAFRLLVSILSGSYNNC